MKEGLVQIPVPIATEMSVLGNVAVHHSLGRQGDDVGLGLVECLRLVGLDVSAADLPVGESEHDRSLEGPDEAGDGRRLHELVADHLLLSPVHGGHGKGRIPVT